jgi:hypothetical protein
MGGWRVWYRAAARHGRRIFALDGAVVVTRGSAMVGMGFCSGREDLDFGTRLWLERVSAEVERGRWWARGRVEVRAGGLRVGRVENGWVSANQDA